MSVKQIGTVEILRPRVYPDDEGRDCWVDPGTYPVVHDEENGIYYFRMEGSPSQRIYPEARKVPGTESLFAIYPPVDVQLPGRETVTSKKMTRWEFEDLISDPVSQEGTEEQRLRFNLF